MSDDREQRLRTGYAAMNAGDFVAAAAALHDDAEWIDPPELVGAGHHVGREAIIAFWESYAEAFSEWQMEIAAIEHLSAETTLVTARMIHTGRESGIPMEFHLFQVWTFADEVATRVQSYLNRDQLQFS